MLGMKKINLREEKEWMDLTTKQKSRVYDICIITYHKNGKDNHMFLKPKECIELEMFLRDERKQFETVQSYDRDIVLQNIWLYLPNQVTRYYHSGHPLINWTDMYKLVNNDENSHIYDIISIKLCSSFYKYERVF